MKLKILLLIAFATITGGSITVVLVQSRANKQQRPTAQENQLPTVMSNYAKTFKLNTSPPLWPDRKGGTNGTSTN